MVNLEENIEFVGRDPLDDPASYRSIGRQVTAQGHLLYFDIARLIRRDPKLSAARVMKMAGLNSEWIVRDIRKPGWHVKNAAHLYQIEAALCRHPLWEPKSVYGQRGLELGVNYVYRRWVGPYGSPEFGDAARAWYNRTSDRAFIAEMAVDPWVTLVDVKADDPLDYRVARYAPAMVEKHNFDKTGEKIRDHVNPQYAEMVASDFHDAVRHDAARCKDLVHLYESRSDRIVFRNIALPCLDVGIVVSKMLVEHWEPGRLKRPADRQKPDTLQALPLETSS